VADCSIDHIREVNRAHNSQESTNSICYLAPDFFYIFIRKTKNPEFIPLLKAWHEIDYKKIQAALQEAINDLM